MLTSSQIALLELIKATLFSYIPSIPEDINWDEVFFEAKHHAVLGLAIHSAPKEESHKWKDYVYQYVMHNMQILHSQKELLQLFDTAKIPLVILKGTAVAIYYSDLTHRLMGDIDFLVSHDQFESAHELMKRNGYTVQYGESEDSIHIGYLKNGIVFEMHRHYNILGLNIEEAIAKGFDHRQNVSVFGCEFPMLPPLENGLILLAHIRHHLLEEECGIGLRQLVDWMMYVHENNREPGWRPSFMELIRKYKLDTLAGTLTAVCKKWLGMPDEIDWSADDVTSEELFDRIMANGNFSVKMDKEELRDKPVRVAYKNIVLVGVFHYLQYAGRKNWKATRRFWILRPFAWIYQLFRYVSKGLSRVNAGKSLIQELSEGKKYSDFLKRLGI